MIYKAKEGSEACMELSDDRRFHCKTPACSKHCCKSYNGNADRLQSIDNNNFSEIILLPEDKERLLAAGYECLVKESGNKHHFIIATEEDGTCLALENDICTIYDLRPAICRAYPLYLDMFAGICEQRECSGVIDGDPREYNKETISSAIDVYEYWIKYYKNIYGVGSNDNEAFNKK